MGAPPMGAVCGRWHPEPGADVNRMPGSPQSYTDKLGEVEERTRCLRGEPPRVCAVFISKVMCIVALQMVMTSVVSLPFMFLLDKETLWQQVWLHNAALFSLVMLVTTTAFILRGPVRRFPWNLSFFCALTVSMGIVTGFACALYRQPSMAIAVWSSASICSALASYAWFTGTDFMGVGPYVFTVSAGLSLLGVLLLAMGSDPFQKLVGTCVAMALCLYIVHDVQRIATGNHRSQFSVSDFIYAATCIYLDVTAPCAALVACLGTRTV